MHVCLLLSHTCNNSTCTYSIRKWLCVSFVAPVLKYIAYAADMPVCLPPAIERKILTAIETKATPGRQGVCASVRVDVYEHVYACTYVHTCMAGCVLACVCFVCHVICMLYERVLCAVDSDSVAFSTSCSGTSHFPQSQGGRSVPPATPPLWWLPPVLNVLVLFKCMSCE